MIDGQFLAETVQVFAQESVAVERTDEIFHDVAFALSQLRLVHLLCHHVVERERIAVDHLLALLVGSHAAMIDGQIFVVAPNVLQRGIECIAALLALALFVVVGSVVGAIAVVGIVVVFGSRGPLLIRRGLQGRVVVHFGLYALHQLRDGQFDELCLQKLLRRNALLQLLFEFLFLYLILCHIACQPKES